jgi:nucleoside-diphosphate-sugar epimerase
VDLVLTGVTGFLGSVVVRDFLTAHPASNAVLPVRANSIEELAKVKSKLVAHWELFVSDFDPLLVDRMSFCTWQDFWNLRGLEREVIVVHCAADTSFVAPLKIARQTNVQLTQKVGQWVWQHRRKIKKMIHVSTAFVAGISSSTVLEDGGGRRRFSNHYERTKWESEQILPTLGVDYIIIRPSIIVGDSSSGYMKNFHVFFSLFRLWLMGVIPRAPLSAKLSADLVPVDFVSNGIIDCIKSELTGRVVHFTANTKKTNAREIFRMGLRHFKQAPRPLFAPFFMLAILNSRAVRWALPIRLLNALDLIEGHLSYLKPRQQYFNNDQCMKDLNSPKLASLNFTEYGDRVFDYCRKTNFGKKALVSK